MPPTTLQQFLLRADLRDFYGLSRGAIDGYQRRGLLPPPDATCSVGPLWSLATLQKARQEPIETLAAVVPIDDELGRANLAAANAYMCPDKSGHFIGWTTPSVIGLVSSGNLAQWHRVRACARFDGPTMYEASSSQPQIQKQLTTARDLRPEDLLTVFLLDRNPLASGHIRVSATASPTAGLQRGRLLRRDQDRVGGPSAWLDLPPRPTAGPLPDYPLPLLDDTFPMLCP